MKGLVRIDPDERTDLDDVHANLAKIIEQMPVDFVPLTIEGTNEHPKAIDFTNIIGTGFINFYIGYLNQDHMLQRSNFNRNPHFHALFELKRGFLLKRLKRGP